MGFFPKPLLRIGEQTFLARCATSMLTVMPRLVIVVGAHREEVQAAVPADERISVAENPAYQRGQLSSIKVGIGALSPAAEAVIVHLVDHPAVAPETFQRLVLEYQASHNPIVVARCGARRGHPVLFAREVFQELLEAPEEIGARAVVNAAPNRVVYVDIDDPGVLLDLDTPEDLARAGLPAPPLRRY